MKKNDSILILGAGGLVGSSIIRELERLGYSNILKPKKAELNLLIQSDVNRYFDLLRPQFVVLAAAKVGGIYANNIQRADFILDNLIIQSNCLKAAHNSNVKKFLFLGSSCIYPKNSPQPIKEEYLLTSELEQTNEPYAIAKIAGLKTAESLKRQYGVNFFSVMPTNLYGENDNFHPTNSHVIPGLIMRMSQALKRGDDKFEVWGSGSPRREFLYVDDLAKACIFLLNYSNELPYWINVGTGEDITIKELAYMIAEEMGYKGEIYFNKEFPDGTPRKLLDTTKINNLGWKYETSLRKGIQKTIKHYTSLVQ